MDSWTEGSQEVETPEQRDTGILGQSYFGTQEDLLGKGNLVGVVLRDTLVYLETPCQ